MTGTIAAENTSHPPALRECRVYDRFSCDLPTSCQPPSDWRGGGQDWPARVCDISAGGLRMILRRRFERGAGLAIELPDPDGGAPSTVLARVVHVRAESGGMWALGCSFVSPLSEEELHALVRPAPSEAAPPDKVISPSSNDFVADVLFRAKLPGGGAVQRLIRKLDVKGAWPLAPGRMIGLRFHDFADRPTVKVRVDACRSSAGRWVLECTFLGEAPAGLSPNDPPGA